MKCREPNAAAVGEVRKLGDAPLFPPAFIHRPSLVDRLGSAKTGPRMVVKHFDALSEVRLRNLPEIRGRSSQCVHKGVGSCLTLGQVLRVDDRGHCDRIRFLGNRSSAQMTRRNG